MLQRIAKSNTKMIKSIRKFFEKALAVIKEVSTYIYTNKIILII